MNSKYSRVVLNWIDAWKVYFELVQACFTPNNP